MAKAAVEKKKVAIYGRVSSEKESQLSAMDNQIEWYEMIAAKHPEWKVVDKYFDKGISGTQTKNRTRFLRMIEDAKQGKFDLIITREVSRFARNTLDTLQYTRDLKKLGVEVYFIFENISTFDKDGEMRLTYIASAAQDDSRKISERAKAGQYTARQVKKVLYGSGNILGYNRVGKTFVIDEEQADTVRMIFDLYLKGYSLKTIKMELTKAGRKNSKGEVKWHESTLSRMLENPMYIGKQYQCQTTVIDYLEHKVKKNDKSEYIEIQGDFKPIIDAEHFERVQTIKSKRVVKNPGKKACGIKHSNDIWMNLLECSCGSSYQQYKWRKNKGTGEIVKGYVCRHRITSGNTKYRIEKGLPLDGACNTKTLSGWVLELMAKDIIEQIWGFRRQSVITAFELIKENFVLDEEDNVDKINELNYKIKKYKQKLKKLLDLYNSDYITLEEFISTRDDYTKQIKDAENELMVVEGGQPLLEKKLNRKLQHIKNTLEQLIDFSTEKLDEDIINQLIDKIIVKGDKEFEWLINLSDIETTDLFNTIITEKIEEKSAKTIEVRDKNYNLAFKSMITIDRAKGYKKTYGKYLRADKWKDINFSVYVR
ncbi:recombinase family protein [Clostridium sp. CX1]|uniref:recombinase family protein n=1 Tax=Clostridium sp. CX1 TaxID=2978346 RepID=UPI0021C0A72F|nr:recombinase family protein [Clostridium sp. CX1]MCT8975007.1 recombinase family protein [Clostridium sp. CX1]